MPGIFYFRLELAKQLPITVNTNQLDKKDAFAPDLLSRIAEGDEQAFRIFFDTYRDRLYTYLFRFSKSRHVAEEVVQEVFYKIWSHRSSLAAVNNPSTYLFVLARNKTVDILRKMANENELIQQAWKNIAEKQHTTEEYLDMNESRRLIEQALSEVSAQKRTIFHLSRYQGLTHQQIADRLQLSESTIKNHIVETLRYIKHYLEKHNGGLAIAFAVVFASH